MVSQHSDGNKGTCCGRRRPILANSPRFQTPAPLSSRPILMMLAGGHVGFIAIRCRVWWQSKDASVQMRVYRRETQTTSNGGLVKIPFRDPSQEGSSSS